VQNKAFNFGPLGLTGTYTTNLLNPATAAGGVNGGSSAQYIILRHVRIVNVTAGAVTFRLYRDTTGGNTAGKEVVGLNMSVPANSFIDWYGQMRFDSADFLVGGASAGTSLTIQGEGEIGVSG
jgi:hypothetical protein